MSNKTQKTVPLSQRRSVGLKLSTPASNNSNTVKKRSLLEGLKHMSDVDVIQIYRELPHATIIIEYTPVFRLEDRTIVYVHSIKINGIENAINMAFYQSTGQSRGTGLEGIWLPTLGIDTTSRTIMKLEDYYIGKYTDVKQISNPENKSEIDNLIKYKRFINEKIALTSKHLGKNLRDEDMGRINMNNIKEPIYRFNNHYGRK